MKRILAFLFLSGLFLLLGLTKPASIFAQSCSSSSGPGHCTPLRCANGELGGYGELGCVLISHCCANANSVPTSCISLGGRCAWTASCPDGTIPSTDCNIGGFRCCATKNSAYTITCTENGIEGIRTAIGCIKASDPKAMTSQLLTWATGIGGGIAFIVIIFAGLQMATAAGDPKRFKAGQELLTSGVGGLILIVLAVLILNFLGVTLLNLNSIGFQTP